jgi:rubrerythrin
MASRRQVKEERKEVVLEKRVEALEKFIAKVKPDTYNFLVNYISQLGKQTQQTNAVALELQDYLNETGQMEKYQQWFTAKHTPVETAEGPVCPQCAGTGKQGDDDECPLCHPNKAQTPPKPQE